MNPEAKAAWLEALRSGDYEQTDRVLRSRDGGYCCLGVACEVAPKELGVTYDEGSGMYRWCNEYGHVLEEGHTLPEPVMEWLGLKSDDPIVRYKRGKVGLSDLNDYKCLTFKEIADIIEAQL